MEKIIIVEDDPMISEIYQRKLSSSGFEVFACDSGEQALALAKKNSADMILLDLLMPKMDGFEVIRNLRGGGYDEDIKIIVFSNLSQKEDREKALKLGANGFIVKSEYSPSQLVEEVKRILNQFSEEKRNERMANGEGIYGEIKKANGEKKILLVEDESIFIEMFGEKLKQEGYQVESAKNGAWGIKRALEEKFDLFIIDMVMPAMTGEEIIQKIKLEEKTKNIPIIAISASVENSMREKVLAMGVDEFFFKTQIIPSELARKVREILNEKK